MEVGVPKLCWVPPKRLGWTRCHSRDQSPITVRARATEFRSVDPLCRQSPFLKSEPEHQNPRGQSLTLAKRARASEPKRSESLPDHQSQSKKTPLWAIAETSLPSSFLGSRSEVNKLYRHGDSRAQTTEHRDQSKYYRHV